MYDLLTVKFCFLSLVIDKPTQKCCKLENMVKRGFVYCHTLSSQESMISFDHVISTTF